MYCLNVYRLGRLPRIALVAAGLALGSWGAQAQDTVKIGFLGPLSGGDAEQGISARNGFQLAVDQANHADLPFKIEPVILDDAANPQTGVAAALKLTNDPEVVAATGHWNSGVALATIPVFSRANIPFIVWGAISPKITEKSNPMVTRVVPTLTNTNAPLAKWAAAQLGKKIAIVSDTTDYGLANVKSFDKFFTEAGGAIVATETAPVGVVTEAGLVRSQMAELGMKQPMIGVDGFYDPEFIKIAGPAADGTISGIIKEEGNAKLTKLTADYNAAKFSEPMGPYTKNAYDATNIIIAALKQAGLKDRAAIAKAIRDTQYDGAMGHTSFDSNGQTTLPVDLELREVKGGVWAAH
jgi:branched-chain amino acid transport system substrate-binding protein